MFLNFVGRVGSLILFLLVLLSTNAAQGVKSGGKIFPLAGMAHPANADSLDQARHDYERVVVMFFAPWCSACENLKPKFHEAARSMGTDQDVRFLLIDATEEIALSLQFDIQYYPFVVLIKGNEAWRWKRGTLVTLEKFSIGDFDASENRFSSWYGPYTRIGLWKYRLGHLLQFVSKTYYERTEGMTDTGRTLWIVGVCASMALVLVISTLAITWMFSRPALAAQNPHED